VCDDSALQIEEVVDHPQIENLQLSDEDAETFRIIDDGC